MDPVIARRTALLKTVAEGLKAQGRQSWNRDTGVCAYRSPSGDKCAVGLLFPDDLDVDFEGAGVHQLLDPEDAKMLNVPRLKAALDKVGIVEDDYPFLKALQRAHDTGPARSGTEEGHFWRIIRPLLVRVAETYGLDRSVIPA